MGVLVLGATAGMVRRAIEGWAKDGQVLYLTGRRAERLEALAADLRLRYGATVYTYVLDIDQPEAIASWWAEFIKAAPRLEKVLISWGYLGQEERARTEDAELEAIVRRNYTAVAQAAGRAAAYLAGQGGGVLGVIASVAGLRGRAKNYHYGSAKAAVIAYCSGLRAYYAKQKVRVVTILPGFVETEMTAELDLPRRLVISAERAGRLLYRIMQRAPYVAYVPGYWRWIMLGIRLLPEAVFMRLPL